MPETIFTFHTFARRLVQSTWHLTALLLLLGCAVGAWGQTDPHATGLRPPTQAELAWEADHLAKTTAVYPNALGLQRINTARAAKGLAPVSASVAVPMGTESETTAAATSVRADLIGLPESVDNSTLPSFPPIRSQGGLGSCAAFSTTYYTMTHMTGLARGWNTKNDLVNTDKFSPKWTYNMINNGRDEGSWITTAFGVMLTNGCATWSEFSYDSDFKAWCMTPAVWRNAINYRMDQTGTVTDLNTQTGLDNLKALLTNGYVLNYATYINSWQYMKSKDDPATPDDDAYVNKDVAYWVNGINGPHGMTVVGYNDNIWTDINNNGVVDAGEKGAFRIANSWGLWKEAGFTWFAYDALKAVSAVTDGPSAGRQDGWWYNSAYWITARTSYTPKVVGQFTINTTKRGQAVLGLGTSDTSVTTPITNWSSDAISYDGGDFAFNGTATAVDGTFYFDFTDIVPLPGTLTRWYLRAYDSLAGDSLTVKAFKIIDVEHGNVESAATNVPQAADASTVYAYTDYRYGITPYLPDLLIEKPTDADYTGNDLYGSVSGQTIAQTALAGTAAVYRLKLTNDGANNDTITITGPVSQPGWTVTYYDALTEGNEIPAETIQSGWALSNLAHNDSREFRVEVTPDATVPIGTTLDVDVTATSIGDNTRTDVVRAQTTKVSLAKPDTWIRNAGDPAYLGNGLYVDTTRQTKAQTLDTGMIGRYDLILENDGALEDAFTLRGPAGSTDWSIHYWYQPDAGAAQEITEQVIDADGWTSPALPIAQSLTCWAEVSPLTSLTDGTVKQVVITATSVFDPLASDAVRAVVIKGIPPGTDIVSLHTNGTQGNASSDVSAVSQDGQLVAFASSATNLVDEDTNTATDVFMRDRTARTTERISVSSTGGNANGNSDSPAISLDGRYVVFQSQADNLVSGKGTRGSYSVYVRDRQTGTTTCITATGNTGPGGSGTSSFYPTISGNGRYVAYWLYDSNAKNANIAMHDRQTSTTATITVASPASAYYSAPSLSENGRYVVLATTATSLVSGDTNGVSDIFLYDRQTSTFSRVSVATDSTQATGASYTPMISADGTRVAFASAAANLVPNDTNTQNDIFLRDLTTSQTTRVSVASDGTQLTSTSAVPRLSGGGRFVVFLSTGSRQVQGQGDLSSYADIYVRDIVAAQTTIVSKSYTGTAQDGYANNPAISDDGKVIAFTSTATNLVFSDTNGVMDVFAVTQTANDLRPGKPDAQVRNAGDTSYTGAGVYNLTGEGQTVVRTVDGGVAAVYQIKVLNARNGIDRLRVTAPAAANGFTIRYFDALSGGTDVTAAVTFGSWTTNELSYNGSADLRMEVTPEAGLPYGTSQDFLVTVTSMYDITQRDAIKVTTVRGYPYRTDMLVRNAGETAYLGNDLLNTDGTNQARTQSVPTGTVAIYHFKLQNDGVRNDTFTVKASPATPNWTVRYYDALSGTNEITTAITSETGWSVAVNAQASKEFRVEVTASALIPIGESLPLLVTATSTGDATSVDAVKATTTKRTTYTNTMRASVDSDEAQGNGDSRPQYISADGRYVVFASVASNLVPGDTNGKSDVFVRDLIAGTTERVSVATDGTEGDDDSGTELAGSEFHPFDISANGRYVVFTSLATNLVADDTNTARDIFIRDRVLQTTTRVSVKSDGTEGLANGPSTGCSISADGRYIAFISGGVLAPNGLTGGSAYVHDRVLHTTELGSVSTAGVSANADTIRTHISPDGSRVVFTSKGTNLTTGDTNGVADVFVRDRQAGTTQIVSVATSGTLGNSDSGGSLSMSGEGRFVAFTSAASNLVSGDTNGKIDVFVRDIILNTTERVSVANDGSQANGMSADGVSVSADGRYVYFNTLATNLVTGGQAGLYVRDRQSAQTAWAITAQAVMGGDGITSFDGRFIVFSSNSAELVPNDTNNAYDVFARDRLGDNPPAYRPDLLIRMPAEVDYIGGTVYDNLPAQTKMTTVSPETTATYFIKAANNGAFPSTLWITGTPGDADWTVRYFDALIGGNEITDEMTYPGGWSLGLAPGDSREFRAEVTSSRSVAHDATKTLLVSALSLGAPTNTDAVAAATTAIHSFRPDLLIKAVAETEFTGDNVYNDVPNQTRTATVMAETAIYQFTVQNDGSTADTYVLTGTPGGGGWTVDYFDALTEGNPLPDITGTDGWTLTLDAGESRTFRVEVTADATVRGGLTKTLLVTVTSTGPGTTSDTVSAVTTKAPLTAVTLVAHPISPVIVETPVTLTATRNGGGLVQYWFRVQRGTTWTTLQAYSDKNTCEWTPKDAGAYALQVLVKEVGSTASFDVYKVIAYTIKPPVSAVSLTVNPSPITAVGVPVKLSAAATGGASVRYKFRVWDGTTWTDIQPYGTANTTVWTPLAAGAYALQVQARDINSANDPDATQTVDLSVNTAISDVSLATAPVSKTVVGFPVTLSAVATGGVTPLYWFRVLSGTTWTDIQPYSVVGTCQWTPKAAGSYTLEVLVKETGSAKLYDRYRIIPFTVKPVITAVSIAPTPSAPTAVGIPVKLTALTSGGANVTFTFRTLFGTTWTDLPLGSTPNTCTWTPQEPGDYILKVFAKELGSANAFDAVCILPYTVKPAVSTLALTSLPSSPTAIGIPVTLTATATDGANLRYMFRITNNGTTWTTLQTYGVKNTCLWKPATAGTFTLEARVREVGSPTEFDLAQTLSITVKTPLSKVALTGSLASPSAVGIPVTLTATPTGGATIEYTFRASTDNGTTWTVIRDYTSEPTFTWTPPTPANYLLDVLAREVGSPKPYDVRVALPYLVNPAISAVALTTVPATQTAINTPVKLTATPTGGGTLRYRFQVNNESGWVDIPTNGLVNTCTWTPKVAGDYSLQVLVHEVGSAAEVDASQSIAYKVTSTFTSVILTADNPSPTTIGIPITMTATVTGGANVLYWFRVKSGTTWTDLQAYSSVNTCTWTPGTTGSYTLEVLVKEAGSLKEYEAYRLLFYTVNAPLTGVAVAANPAQQSVVGTPVTLTMTPVGGGTVQYTVRVSNGAGWTDLQVLSTTNSLTWRPTVAGNYIIQVIAHETGAPPTAVVKCYLDYRVTLQ